ncbi:MAG: OsmC family protein [Hyphomicrobiales bacterium]
MSTLKDLIADTQSQFRLKPAAAKATFATQSNLKAGFRSEVDIRQHSIVIDEPAALGGADTGPNPVELVLAALGSCQEITYRAYAAALGIPLESVSVKLEGEIDLRGFFAVDEGVRPGYEAVRGTVTLVSGASAEDLALLRGAVDGHCPVLDILRNPVPVALDLNIEAPAAAN